MNDKYKIAAVVVTYNRKEVLRECLNALLVQTRSLDEIIVVDNASTDGTDKMVAIEFPKVTYIKLPENICGAGGFHEGMKFAYEKGYDWIWAMDDDVIPFQETLEELIKEALRFKTHVVLPAMITDLTKKTVRPGLLLAGGLLSRQVIQLAGLPRPEFFIYWDDMEFGWRIEKKGFQILQSKQAYVRHSDWLNQPHKFKKIFGKRISAPQYPDWKAYYIFRNEIYAYRLHGRFHPRRYVRTVGELFIIYLLLNEHRKCWYIIRGIIDCFLGRMGKRVLPKT